MRILPNCLGDDERRLGWNAAEDVDPLALARNETVPHIGAFRVRSNDLISVVFHGLSQQSFQLLLRGPALPIGALAQVTTGDEIDGFWRLFELAILLIHRHAQLRK